MRDYLERGTVNSLATEVPRRTDAQASNSPRSKQSMSVIALLPVHQ